MQNRPDRRRRLALALPGALALAGASRAQVPTPAAPPRLASTAAARVQAVQMPAWVEDAAGRRALAPGEAVGACTVSTGTGAALVLRTGDGSQLQLGAGATLVVEALALEDGPQPLLAGRLRLAEGMLRYATGAIAAATGRRRLEVQLRTATIGIRGTDFWTMTDAQHDAVCLFEGRVALATRDQGELVLEQPTAFWARFFAQAPQPVAAATPAQLATFLASTALRAGQGIALEGGRWRLEGARQPGRGPAQAQVRQLQEAGYAARLARRGAAAWAEVAQLASEADALAVGERIAGLLGGAVRVARD